MPDVEAWGPAAHSYQGTRRAQALDPNFLQHATRAVGFAAVAAQPGGVREADPVLDDPFAKRASGTTSSESSVHAPTGLNLVLPCNPGSSGHPMLCGRSCIFHRSGNCANGDTCTFCHEDHTQRVMRFTKKYRSWLDVMPMSEIVALAWPILQEKALTVGIPSEHLWPLLQISAEAGRSSGYPRVPDHVLPKLLHSLSSLNLRSMLKMLERQSTPGSREEAIIREVFLGIMPALPEPTWKFVRL